jgi:hypothetical protein
MARELIRDETFTVTEEELASLPSNPLKVVDPSTSYTIRAVTDARVQRLRAKHTSTKWVNHQMVEKFDGLAFANELIDEVLVDWQGITYHGEAMPCTSENKVGLDESVRTALIERSRMNRIVKEDSFRPTTESR